MLMKMSKVIVAIAVLALLALTLASCSGGVENDVCVYDNANIISDADEKMINDAAKNATNGRFIVATHNADNGEKLYGETVLADLGYSKDENAVIFVITLRNSTYYCDIYTYGAASRRISDSEVDEILLWNEGVIAGIKSGRFGEALSECIERSNRAIELPWVVIIVIAVVVGGIGGGIAAGTVAAKYKMKLRPTNYPLDKYAKMELTDSDDEFINSRVSVQYISNGGGGSRGGGGGGYGGGSGHRGGV